MLEIELFWHLKYILIVDWIVWNGTIFVFKTELLEIDLTLTWKLFLRYTELSKIEQVLTFDCV